VARALLIVENDSVPADTRVWPECLSLRAAGWEVSVISPSGRKRDREPFLSLEGVEIHRFELPESGGGGVGYLREYGVALARIRRLVRKLGRAHVYDVVHACNPPDMLLVAAHSLRLAGAATIFDQHDLSPELFLAKYQRRFPLYHGLLATERLGFKLSDVVLAANDSFRRVAIERGGKSADDVFVVRNGPDTTVFHPVPGDPELRSSAPHLIGYVGLIGSQDGLDLALDALAELRTRRTDWHLLVVGDGDALPAARQQVARLELGAFVTFAGFVQDRGRLVEMIASCDVCLSPEPRNELNERSTLVKVAEYMAVGRPVVAFDLSETRTTAGAAAAYAAGEDSSSYAAAIEALLDDAPGRARMGAEGLDRVRALSWERSEEALLAAYDRALWHRSRRASKRN
jgi:glycosyltransferase involved in cell wall biosynthesis